MQHLHAELAVEQGIDFSVRSGNESRKYLLEREANSTMNHEIVPKSIDALLLTQSVSAHLKKKKNARYEKFAGYDKYAK